MIGVYTITNRLNGMRYVGCSHDIKQRWAYHRAPSRWKRRCGKIARAVYEEGIDNFQFEVIEECKTSARLYLREIYWIKKLKPEYNTVLSGGMCRRPVHAPFKKRAALRFHRKLHARLKRIAIKRGMTLQDLAEHVVGWWLSLSENKRRFYELAIRNRQSN